MPLSSNEPVIRVGLSVRKLCDPQFAGQVDGIGVYTRHLWRELDRSGAASVVPVTGFGRRPLQASPECSGGFAFPLAYGASAMLSIVSGASFSGAAALDASIDVYHATDYWIPRLRGIPVVATLHDAIPLSNPEWGSPRFRSLKNAILRRSALWADAVITVSHAMVESIIEDYAIPAERIHVIHNGVEEKWFEEISERDRERVLRNYGLRASYFLSVGTLQPRKNLARLLRAHGSLPEALRRERPLVVVGKRGWGVDDLIPALEQGQARGEVVWLDYVPDDELRALFQSAGALAFPSLYEGFGLPVVEAFASAVPVLTSTTSGLPEVAGDAALLVDPEDEDAIRDGLLRITEDEALRSRLVTAGLHRARQFSWRSCAEAVTRVYRLVD